MKENVWSPMLSSRKLRINEAIYVRFVREIGKRIELAILIDDDTTAEQLRSAWPDISHLREILRVAQGTDLRGAKNLAHLLLLKKYQLHTAGGASYAEIAMETNYDCLVNLCRAFLGKKNGDMEQFREGLYTARAQLLAVRMREDEVAQWITGGLAEIEEGHAPWTLEKGPVDAQRLRDSLRYLERLVSSNKLVVKNTELSWPRTQMMSAQEIHTHYHEDSELANELLEKEPDGGGLQELRAAIQRQMGQPGEDNSG